MVKYSLYRYNDHILNTLSFKKLVWLGQHRYEGKERGEWLSEERKKLSLGQDELPEWQKSTWFESISWYSNSKTVSLK